MNLTKMVTTNGDVKNGGIFNLNMCVVVLILSVAFSLVLGLSLVWFNIERMDMAYDLKKLQGEVDKRISLTAKLEIERDRLTAPNILFSKAGEFKMYPAKLNQIRHISQQ
ncbi:hypothetical protein [Desulfovibrio litoralis]|uniref:Cell division protein FtsL n=1 Tax=Desulfovibrio litoralis DSM 11393 TaxID=1121455 RepID=A0A1M7SLF1_9BACT|nr:hypothetical protein [Desulfovibrio litoralis]SHN59311.1 hypothetical protein SAMN02745728_00994 [Desulfovibrio litoralis DSM 11393]